MPIVRIPYPNALPTIQADFVAQNNLIRTGFLQVNKSIWEDAANNIVQGAVFQIGGTVYYCNAATAIGGGPSAYIKLTPSGDGSIVTPTYVANLAGVSWNSAHNGYYDVGNNAYVFDELVAIDAGEIAAANTRLWKAFTTLINGNFNFSGNPIFSGNPAFSGNPTFNNPITNNGRRLAGRYSAANPTEAQVYAALSAFLPNINDELRVTGGLMEENGTDWIVNVIVYTRRRTATILEFGLVTMVYSPSADDGEISALSGNASAFRNVTLAGTMDRELSIAW